VEGQGQRRGVGMGEGERAGGKEGKEKVKRVSNYSKVGFGVKSMELVSAK